MGNDIHTHTLGCKVNFSDTQLFAETIKCDDARAAAVIGTCCVTVEGEKQSRKEVRRALKRVGPNGKVYVTGCAVRLDPVSFNRIAENVEVVPDRMQAAVKTGSTATAAQFDAQIDFKNAAETGQRTRFFLKVQDGCGRRCSYCIIPFVRGEPESIPMRDVLSLATDNIQKGYQEIVITGINVGAYKDGNAGIAGLIERLSHLDGLKRMRLSSIEAPHINKDMLKVMADNLIIGRHLHIPLQSGDDTVLKSMGRSYGLSLFLEKINMVRDALPDINLTTDVIVGFPTENVKSFEKTLRMVEEIGFTKVHVFPYSPRPGTKAHLMDDKVTQSEKKRRSCVLRELSDRLGSKHRQGKIGLVEEILLESSAGNGKYKGYSVDYTHYIVDGGKENRLVAAKGIKVTSASIDAKLVERVWIKRFPYC